VGEEHRFEGRKPDMELRLDGRVAIVTGAGSQIGIGRAIARLFAEAGAQLGLLDVDVASVSALAHELPGKHLGIECDVTDVASVRRAVAQVGSELGPVTVLVNNAGVTQRRAFSDITGDDYARVVDVSLHGGFLCSQEVLPFMKESGGSIVFMSSVSAENGGGLFGGAHYCSAKAGLIGLTRALAKEMAPYGIRANAVAPGVVDTDITHGELTAEGKLEIAATVPLQRLGTPADVAACCLFLASDASSYITGEVLNVNGGIYFA
jgi:NAD(P)-dependent dehydrogenase (short-subunit alcohol dehydrogenase family)